MCLWNDAPPGGTARRSLGMRTDRHPATPRRTQCARSLGRWLWGLAGDKGRRSLSPAPGCPENAAGAGRGGRHPERRWQRVGGVPVPPRCPGFVAAGWCGAQGAAWSCPSSCQSISCSLSALSSVLFSGCRAVLGSSPSSSCSSVPAFSSSSSQLSRIFFWQM